MHRRINIYAYVCVCVHESKHVHHMLRIIRTHTQEKSMLNESLTSATQAIFYSMEHLWQINSSH